MITKKPLIGNSRFGLDAGRELRMVETRRQGRIEWTHEGREKAAFAASNT
jgi:hypothetical protein